MAQLYGSNRAESYTPSHGSTQNVYLVAKPFQSDETNQARIKPLVVNYHPSGGTAGPQRYVAEIQTVSREVIRRPVAVPVKEIERGYGSHVDGRPKRDDQFIARLQDAAIKANTGKLLGLNLDQPQVVPTNYQGKSTIDDRWGVQPNSFDEQNPRKVAELFNKVSNWRGTNGGLDRGRSGDAYEGWINNKPSDRYKQPTQSSSVYGKGYYGGQGSQAKLDDGYAGRNNNLQAPRIGKSYTDQGGNYVGSGSQIERPFTPQGYDNLGKPGLDDSYTSQTENLKGGGGLNKPLSTQQSYGQPASYGGDAYGKPSSIRGDHSDSEDGNYGNHGSVEVPRVGSGYTGQRENLNGGSGLNKPLSTHQGYDQPTSYRGDTNMKPGGMSDSHQPPRAGGGYNSQADQFNGGIGWKKPITKQQVYDQPTSYGGDNKMKPGSMSDSQQSPRARGGYTSQADQFNGGIGWKKPIATQQVYDRPTSYGGDNKMKPGGMSDSQQSPRARGGYTSQADQFNGGARWKKPIATQQAYEQPTSYGGDTIMKPGGMGDSQQSPRAGDGYTSQEDQFNGGIGRKKPVATQQVYDQPISNGGGGRKSPISKSSDYSDSESKGYGNPFKSGDYQGRSNNSQAQQGYGYNRPRAEYDGGKQGYGYNYGDGVDTRRQDKPAYETYGSSYNSSARPNAVRPAGINAPEITSKQAVRKYNGAFV